MEKLVGANIGRQRNLITGQSGQSIPEAPIPPVLEAHVVPAPLVK